MSISKQTHIVITVYGIRTFGQWQRRLERLLSPSDARVSFYHFEYGYFSMIAFFFPFTRWIMVRRFRRELRSIVARTQPTRLDLVGHSFGTHLIAWALRGLDANEHIHVHTLILAGSVLRSDFYWADLVPSRVSRVINDAGAKDVVLLASQFLVLFTGMAGRTGFVGMNGPDFSNRYSMFGHSGYFQDPQGRPNDAYMEKHCVPLILYEDKVETFDKRDTPTPWRGFVIWITNNFEPIKLVVVTTPFVAGLIWVTALYVETNATKERMAAVIDLGEAMKQRNNLPEEAKPLLATLQQALAIPLAKKTVLWVDDNPTNNLLEKRALEMFGLCFVQAKSTNDALRLLNANPGKFSVVISDFHRPQDSKSGYGLLDEMKKRNSQIPFIFYAFSFTEDQVLEAKARGAQAEVRGAIDLWAETFAAIHPDSTSVGRLELITQQVLGCAQGGTNDLRSAHRIATSDSTAGTSNMLQGSQLRRAWADFECNVKEMTIVPFGHVDKIRIAPPSAEAFEALASVMLHHGYEIRSSETDSYFCRTISGGSHRSVHSYGIALDVNWNTNPRKTTPDRRMVRFSSKPTQDGRAEDVRSGHADTDFTPTLIADVLKIATKKGQRTFRWGGDYSAIKKASHFEVALSPQELEIGIDPATVVKNASVLLPSWQ